MGWPAAADNDDAEFTRGPDSNADGPVPSEVRAEPSKVPGVDVSRETSPETPNAEALARQLEPVRGSASPQEPNEGPAPEPGAPDVSRETSVADDDGATTAGHSTSDVAREPPPSAKGDIVGRAEPERGLTLPREPDHPATQEPGPPDVSRETWASTRPDALLDSLSSVEPSPRDQAMEPTPIAAEAERATRILTAGVARVLPPPPATRIMTVSNQKGGVGKTTTAVNVAVALALQGSRVVLVDLDPQGNASTALAVPHHSGVPSIYEVLVDGLPMADAAVQVAAAPLLTCVPASIDLAGAEIELVSVVARESRLQRALTAYLAGLSAAGRRADYVLIDCPPSLGLLTLNALVAADEVFLPIQCEYYALEGLEQLGKTIERVRIHLNADLHISTILLTMYDARTRLADQVAAEVRRFFGDKVLDSVIPRSVRVSEAPGFGQSVITYDPGSRGALAYFEAARDLALRGADRPAAHEGQR